MDTKERNIILCGNTAFGVSTFALILHSLIEESDDHVKLENCTDSDYLPTTLKVYYKDTTGMSIKFDQSVIFINARTFLSRYEGVLGWIKSWIFPYNATLNNTLSLWRTMKTRLKTSPYIVIYHPDQITDIEIDRLIKEFQKFKVDSQCIVFDKENQIRDMISNWIFE